MNHQEPEDGNFEQLIEQLHQRQRKQQAASGQNTGVGLFTELNPDDGSRNKFASQQTTASNFGQQFTQTRNSKNQSGNWSGTRTAAAPGAADTADNTGSPGQSLNNTPDAAGGDNKADKAQPETESWAPKKFRVWLLFICTALVTAFFTAVFQVEEIHNICCIFIVILGPLAAIFVPEILPPPEEQNKKDGTKKEGSARNNDTKKQQ